MNLLAVSLSMSRNRRGATAAKKIEIIYNNIGAVDRLALKGLGA